MYINIFWVIVIPVVCFAGGIVYSFWTTELKRDGRLRAIGEVDDKFRIVTQKFHMSSVEKDGDFAVVAAVPLELDNYNKCYIDTFEIVEGKMYEVIPQRLIYDSVPELEIENAIIYASNLLKMQVISIEEETTKSVDFFHIQPESSRPYQIQTKYDVTGQISFCDNLYAVQYFIEQDETSKFIILDDNFTTEGLKNFRNYILNELGDIVYGNNLNSAYFFSQLKLHEIYPKLLDLAERTKVDISFITGTKESGMESGPSC